MLAAGFSLTAKSGPQITSRSEHGPETVRVTREVAFLRP
jgi:hypothetical protein